MLAGDSGGSASIAAHPAPFSGLASPLATVEPAGERSEQMEQIARQADRQTRHGLELAGRGAYFAARSEFFAALRLIAEGLDAEHAGTAAGKGDSPRCAQRGTVPFSGHGRALEAALLAMQEAEDFLPGGPRPDSDRDLSGVIAGHSTPVLKGVADGATPMTAGNGDSPQHAPRGTVPVSGLTALRSYFTFAQEQFAAAAGREVAGSMALRALGKLHEALAEKKAAAEPAAASKAMVFYQAALLVDPKNYMAANDLGVLLARCGNTADARTTLEYSLSLSPQPTTWHNLAVVYRQLGQPALADRAGRWAAALEQAELARRNSRPEIARRTIHWVDTETFAATSRNTPNSLGATPQLPAQAAGQPVEPGRLSPAGPPDLVAQPSRLHGAGGTPAPQGSDALPRTAGRPTTAERLTWGQPPYQR
jgi:tetratricopeptide (TPR) repeat protein